MRVKLCLHVYYFRMNLLLFVIIYSLSTVVTFYVILEFFLFFYIQIA